MAKVCLVLEGGGNRGAYTSGVLDALLDNKIFINDTSYYFDNLIVLKINTIMNNIT